MSTTPIADHAQRSDRHSSHLVAAAGTVEWLRVPRFSSAACVERVRGRAVRHRKELASGQMGGSGRRRGRSFAR